MKPSRCSGLAVAIAWSLVLAPSIGAAQNTAGGHGFNWFANGAQTSSTAESLIKAREAVRKARGLNANATWICSPAGFGQGSRCTKG